MFEGSCVALVTPMGSDGGVDLEAVNNLVDWHVCEGTAALVVAGTTGESATLTKEEWLNLLKAVRQRLPKRIPLIAGCGTNATTTTIEKVQAAKESGADAALVVTPYYNRPTQSGLVAHYTAIAKASSLPLFLYNVPSRTGCDLLPDSAAILSRLPTILGIKESSTLERLTELKAVCATDFLFYSGDDAITLDFIEQGGHGVISVTANVVPRLMQRLCQHALKGEKSDAQKLHRQLMPLYHALFKEPNPIPVKWALSYLGKIKEGIRLPLTPLSTQYHTEVQNALEYASN